MDERDYYLAFSLANNIGPIRLRKLVNYIGSAKSAWLSTKIQLEKAGLGPKTLAELIKFREEFVLSDYLNKLKNAKCDFIAFCDKDYPQGLNQLSNPPIVLFIKGDKSCLKSDKTIGVVGARKMTSYGTSVTESLIADLTAFGFTIVSGMALGVDARAHESCLNSGGKTIAVLGNGVDLPFPRENENLYYKIIDSGGLIVSEYPLGMSPSIGSFPARNRIIAALSLGILITEAAEDSGSLITASNAASLGKKIFAVPGPITSRMSDGSLKLLKEGAVVVSGAQDILKQLQINNEQLTKGEKKINLEKLNLSKDEKAIFKLLENEGMTSDEIAKKLKVPIWKISVVLSGLEMKNVIKNSEGKFCLANI